MNSKYIDFILKNVDDGELNSFSNNIELFCEEFGLKIQFGGELRIKNSTFSKCLRYMEKKNIIRYAFAMKGYENKGGSIVSYGYTKKGMMLREMMIDGQ